MALKFNTGFSIKPVKKSRTTSGSTQVKHILYCTPVIKDDVVLASVNTRGEDGYQEVTVLPFTKRSFFTKGKIHIFSKEKDKTNHYEHIIRNVLDARFPASKKYTPLCPTSVYRGRLIKIGEEVQFDVIDYIGHIRKYERLLLTSRKETEEIETE